MEKKTIELDGKLYEIRLVEPEPTEPKLPTLMDVFNKVKPKWQLLDINEIEEGNYIHSNKSYHAQLSTYAQCKRIQTIIALQNIADYYNQEVDYRGEGCTIRYYEGEFSAITPHSLYPLPVFKEINHCKLAIEILRNENLLDNLK